MKAVKIYFPAAVLIATLALAAGFGLSGRLPAVGLALAGAALIGIGASRDWRWVDQLILLGFIAGSAAGLYLQVSPVAMVIGAAAGLAAWDLRAFARRIAELPPDDRLLALEKQHLNRLLQVVGIGLLVAALPLIVQFRLPFLALFLLGGLCLYGLNRLIFRLQGTGLE